MKRIIQWPFSFLFILLVTLFAFLLAIMTDVYGALLLMRELTKRSLPRQPAHQPTPESSDE